MIKRLRLPLPRLRFARRPVALVAALLLLVPVVWVMGYRFVDPPVTPLMLLRSADGAGRRFDWVPLGRISPELVRAVIAAEDTRFCRHWGFDLGAIERALVHNEAGGKLIGASTISQQTAKNAFLWPERSWLRKGLEVGFTGLIELLWPKRRILEVYLNIVEWAPGVYGAEAAARHHFGRSAAVLTGRQAALLAVVLPAPRRWSARSPGPYVRSRAAIIERRAMVVDRDRLAACVE